MPWHAFTPCTPFALQAPVISTWFGLMLPGLPFADAKTLIADASLLVHPPHAPLRISSDASDTGIGAMLEQFQCGH